MTKTYSPKLLREIDAAVAEHCFGFKPEQDKSVPRTSEQYCHPHYTTDPAASDALDDVILKNLDAILYEVYEQAGRFHYKTDSRATGFIEAVHPDKKIARAIFALRLMAPNAEVLKKV